MRYRKGTFITVPNKDAIKGLDPQAQVLYLWLNHYADDNGECFPSIDRLASDCGMSRDTVIRRLELLCTKGLVQKQNQYQENRQVTNLYTIELVGEGSTEQPPQSLTATPGGSREQHRTKTIGTQSNIYTIKEKVDSEFSGNSDSVNTIPPYTTAPVNDDGEVIRKPAKKPKPQYGNATLSVLGTFNRMVQEHVGVEAPTGQKYFFIVQSTAKKHNFSTDDFRELFDYFFSDNLTPEMKTSLQLVCSDSYITKWKARKANKPITQLEAAEGIRL